MPVYLTQFWEVFEKASQRRLFLKWTLSGRWCLLCVLKGEVIQGKVGRREKDIWGRKYNVQDTHVLVSTSWLFVGVVQSLSHVQIFATSVCQYARFLCPSLPLRVCSNSCPLSQWHHPTISSSVTSFSSCPQSLPASVSFQCVSSSYQVAKVLELQCQHQSFQRIFRADFLQDWSPCFSKDSQESSPAPQFEIINSLVLSLLYSPTPTSIHAYWKNHSFDYMYR